MKKFEKEDILRNVIKTHPKSRFICYNGKIYHNNSVETALKINNFLQYKEPQAPVEIDGAIVLEDGTFLLNEDGTYLMLEE